MGMEHGKLEMEVRQLLMLSRYELIVGWGRVVAVEV